MEEEGLIMASARLPWMPGQSSVGIQREKISPHTRLYPVAQCVVLWLGSGPQALQHKVNGKEATECSGQRLTL